MVASLPRMARFGGISLHRANDPRQATATIQYTDVDREIHDLEGPLIEGLARMSLLRGMEKDQSLEPLTEYAARQHGQVWIPSGDPIIPATPERLLTPAAPPRDPMFQRLYQ